MGCWRGSCCVQESACVPSP